MATAAERAMLNHIQYRAQTHTWPVKSVLMHHKLVTSVETGNSYKGETCEGTVAEKPYHVQ